jgi:hypothetical protein
LYALTHTKQRRFPQRIQAVEAVTSVGFRPFRLRKEASALVGSGKRTSRSPASTLVAARSSSRMLGAEVDRGEQPNIFRGMWTRSYVLA